jgi:PAS domain S-box-containing protein
MILVFYCITLFSVCWYGYQEYRATVDNATRQSENQAKMLAEHAARTLGEVDTLLHSLDDHLQNQSVATNLDEKKIYDLLNFHFKKLPQLVSFFLISSEGKLVASTLGYPSQKIDVADREYFQYLRDHPHVPFYISKAFRNRITGGTIFSLTRRISAPDGSFGGILAATVNVTYFESFYDELLKSTNTHIGLYKDDGSRIVEAPTEAKELGVARTGRVKRFPFHSTSGSVHGKDLIDGEESLIGYAEVPGGFGLVSVVETHWDRVLLPWRKWTLEHLILTLMFMFPFFFFYRRMVERLRQDQINSEELSLLSRIVDQSPVTIVITDKDGNINYVNKRFCELTGYSREEAIGQNPRVLKTDITPAETFISMWQNLVAGKEWRGELCNKKKSGSLYWEMAYIFPVSNSLGELTHYAAIKENITAQKEAVEEMLRARLAAEEANRSKSLFLATMSHEIRTPMNAILGMSYLVLQSGLDPRQQGYVEKTIAAAKSLLSIINDILDFSKIEAGKMGLEKVSLNFSELMEGVKNIVDVASEEKGLSVEYHLDTEVPLNVIGDPTRLRQVLINLVGNAVKFTESGKVEVGIRRANILADEGIVEVTFSVIDSGIGMDNEQLELIFAPFAQADSSITRRYGGTGLGLSIVKKLVEMMGGALTVISRSGEGSRFYFTLQMPIYHSEQISEHLESGQKPDSEITACEDEKLIDIELIHPLLISLYNELEGHRGSALQSYRSLKPLMSNSVAFVRLGVEIERFNFKAAIASLESICCELNIQFKGANDGK